METIECKTCEQQFSSQLSLQKHNETNKHKKNKKMKNLISSNIKLSESKKELSEELGLIHEELSATKIKLKSQKYDFQNLTNKIDLMLARLEEISNMIKLDREILKKNNKEIVSTKENEITTNYFGIKKILLSTSTLILPLISLYFYRKS